MARAVAVKGRERTVTLLCELCGHRWDAVSEDPPATWTGRKHNLQ
jgi:hypothetical protein